MTRWRRLLALVVVASGLAVAPRAGALSQPVRTTEPTMGPLISGTWSQLNGTFVWTDYAYDDRGTNPKTFGAYPKSAGINNAADLIQLQVTPGNASLGLQAVLETLSDPKVPSVGVGLDLDGRSDTGAPTVPGGRWKVSGQRLGLERMIVMTGKGATVLSYGNGRWTRTASEAAFVDTATNTMRATIPNADLGPLGRMWRVVGLAGLALPGANWADGSGEIYDLAYVRDESVNDFQSDVQSYILRGETPSELAVGRIDTTNVRAETRLATPKPGVKETFLYRSQLDLGEGIRISTLRTKAAIVATNSDEFAGPYQPYAAWFPARGLPARPPMLVFLHGSLGDHLGGAYGGDTSRVDLDPLAVGNLNLPAVIITPLGRSSTALGGYDGPAEQDILDAMADATRRFSVDEDRIALTGYSLGGVGTFRLAQLYPDKWAGAVDIVGADDLGAITLRDELEGIQTMPNQLENLRNLQFRMAHSQLDELELLVGAIQPDRAALQMQLMGYDYRFWKFTRRDHVSFPVATVQCELAAALARGRVVNPARVTFSQEPAIALRHDSAYWMSRMVVRGRIFKPGEKGTVDVTSLARADRGPKATPFASVRQNITAGRDVCGPNPEVKTNDTWYELGQRLTPGSEQPVSNAMVVDVRRVASFDLDVARMSLDVSEPLRIESRSDGITRITLHGAWPGGSRVVTIPKGVATTWIPAA